MEKQEQKIWDFISLQPLWWRQRRFTKIKNYVDLKSSSEGTCQMELHMGTCSTCFVCLHLSSILPCGSPTPFLDFHLCVFRVTTCMDSDVMNCSQTSSWFQLTEAWPDDKFLYRLEMRFRPIETSGQSRNHEILAYPVGHLG